jgi:hypothetical protein
MATLNLLYKTLADHAKLKAPDGSELIIAEILEQSTPIMEDMPMIEGNLVTGHKVAIRTELPAASWVRYYEGIAATKGRRQVITFTAGRLRSKFEEDADLLKLNRDENISLMDSAKEHLMGMGQDLEDEFIYGTKEDPEKIVGLAATYDHISTSETDVGYNVLSGGGAGADNTSIWLVYWGMRNIHGIFPKGSKAGIEKVDYGRELIPAPDGGGDYEARRMIFKVDAGLAIPDWRSVVRIANIDVSELADAGESTYDGAALLNLLTRAIHRPRNQVKAMGRPIIYANETVITALDLIANNKSTLALKSSETVEGKPKLSFRGVPIHRADRIINTEAVVS